MAQRFFNQVTSSLQAVKNSQTRLVGYYIFNPNTSAAYLQIFDAPSSSGLTLGSSTPNLVFGLGAGEIAFVPVNDASIGWEFQNGIVIAASTTPEGNIAPSSQLVVNLAYM